MQAINNKYKFFSDRVDEKKPTERYSMRVEIAYNVMRDIGRMNTSLCDGIMRCVFADAKVKKSR